MLTGLRKLGVTEINKKNGPAFCSAISSLSRLESLSVRSAGKQGLRGCLDDISSPPESLQSLKLYGNLGTLPEWIKELPHLVKLKLVKSRLLDHEAALEFLGKLPKLEILVLPLAWSVFQGEELVFKRLQAGITFGSLRVLWFSVGSRVKSVTIEQGTMPNLEWLYYFEAEVDNEFCFSGLEFLESINEVQLNVSFPWTNGTWEEVRQDEARKKGELKKKIQAQLARNANEPIVTMH